MRSIFIALLLCLVLPIASPAEAKKKVEKTRDLENTIYLDLKDGRVVIELFHAFAPKTVERIKTLTRDGFYDGAPFHRVSAGFMAQTGDPRNQNGTGGSDLPDMDDEFSIKRHWRGHLSMANAGLKPDGSGTNNSQFFILFEDAESLNNRHSVFGKVVEGMKYVDKIKKGDPRADGAITDGEPDRILRMRVAADVVGTEDENWHP